jgi:nicotinamidase-related amidase
MATALLVIDVQRAICSGEWAAFDIHRVLERINGLIAKARAAAVPTIFIHLRVRKTTPDSFYRTPLQDMLQQQGITRLVICGLQSDFCIDSTVRRALTLDYHAALASDAHSTLDDDVLTAAQITAHHNTIFKNMTSFGSHLHVIPVDEVLMETEQLP